MNVEKEMSRLRQETAPEPTRLPLVVRERMDRLYAALPDYGDVRRSRARRRYGAAAAIGLLAIVLVLAASASPGMGGYLSRLPVIGSAWIPAGGPFAKTPPPIEEQTATDRDIPLTLTDVRYDGQRLSVAIRHADSVKIDAASVAVDVDGQPIGASPSGAYAQAEGDEVTTVFRYDAVPEMPTSFAIDIRVGKVELLRNGGQTLDGSWSFQERIERWKQGIRDIRFDPPLVSESDGLTLSVLGVKLTPVATELSVELTKSASKQQQKPAAGDFVLVRDYAFRLAYDAGEELEPLPTAARYLSDQTERYTVWFEPLSEDAAELRLSVDELTSVGTSDGKGGFTGASRSQSLATIPVGTTFPLTVDQGGGASIVFRRIEFGADATRIDYQLQGPKPYERIVSWMLNDGGDRMYTFNREDAVKLNDAPYTYRVELPGNVDPAKAQLDVVRVAPYEQTLSGLDAVLPLKS